MKTRAKNEFDIAQLYGTAGPAATELLARLINELGLDALTDEAIDRLAQLHREREERDTAASFRRNR
jgi:hypothetical protein